MRCRPLRFVTPVLLLQPSNFSVSSLSVALPAERVEKLNHFIGLAHAAHSLCHFCIRSLFRCFDSSYRFFMFSTVLPIFVLCLHLCSLTSTVSFQYTSYLWLFYSCASQKYSLSLLEHSSFCNFFSRA